MDCKKMDYDAKAKAIVEEMKSLGIGGLMLESMVLNDASIPDFAWKEVIRIAKTKYL